MADLVILTEAGGSAGFGHLMRCLAIANETDAELYVNADGDYPDNNRSKKRNTRQRFPGKTPSFHRTTGRRGFCWARAPMWAAECSGSRAPW